MDLKNKLTLWHWPQCGVPGCDFNGLHFKTFQYSLPDMTSTSGGTLQFWSSLLTYYSVTKDARINFEKRSGHGINTRHGMLGSTEACC